ncbi:MAG: ABC transporter permease [Vicinamibacterales bacterium]|jgi:ABC-2 type transport system permease protein|nr:ABC transporter [Acidobacteriota bacterium]MDP6372359.1 ABC transporter permease [Vicinamibacterales bacterium]MDP6608594.1 ABC transporter permease [Vicinamibacterales bacterium]HAK54372.1 ABC transporter [Acidobacteriota bacterium]|tara:strand:+ start:735 stop:1508 length:774 start_codon:yes stop_codon:yes gene_type:complete
MRNALAIAQREIASYFASPIAYVLIGFFALLFGYFYSAILAFFLRQSLQVGQFGFGGPTTINVNQDLIRPLMINATVILLFVLPMVTMRSYSEEKRSGTIELLLTSPLSDLQIIMGKFLGAMALYSIMLAITLVHIGMLFMYGEPEWLPVATGYLGLLLLGGCFVSVGLLISSMTKNQVVSGMATFAVFLMLWVINWMADTAGPVTQAVLNYLSITEHFDDFSRGVLDTKHIVYYLSFIAFGLFLTAKSVDSERWRG